MLQLCGTSRGPSVYLCLSLRAQWLTRCHASLRPNFVSLAAGLRARRMIDDLSGRVVDPERRSIDLTAADTQKVFETFVCDRFHFASSLSRIGMTQAKHGPSEIKSGLFSSVMPIRSSSELANLAAL